MGDSSEAGEAQQTSVTLQHPVVPAAGMLLLLGIIGYFGAFGPSASPPPVVPAAEADSEEFSAERAREHLREITRAPSPVGSEEHARVRAYLLDQLEALGLEPDVQHTTAMRNWFGTVHAGTVRNIVARIPGTDPTRAVVLMSHYDTVPHAPGATDAGNGVAAILETARALLAGEPLRNDVILLLTDAEEVGLLGAQAFVDQHPWVEDVGVVLNAEGRGYTGPVTMFRTAGNNGQMIRTLARSVPNPAATSLSDAVFQHMPNDTDLTIFAEANLFGMDFANGNGITHYHTPLDNFEWADPRSLQHHGDYMVNLARAFGQQNLTEIEAPGRVYFSLPAIGLVHYPLSWALPIAILVALFVLVVMGWGVRAGHLTLRGTAGGLLLFLILLAALPALAMFGWQLLSAALPEPRWFWHGSPYNSSYYLVAFTMLAVALFLALAMLLRRWLTWSHLLAGALLVWMTLALITAVLLPGGSYLFVWPLLFAAAALGYVWLESPEKPLRSMVVLGVAAVPVLVLVLPLVEILEVMLTIEMIAAPIAVLTLLLGLLALQLEVLERGFGWVLPAGVAAVGLLALVGGLLTAGFDADHKKPSGVNYIADSSAGEAYWYSFDPEVDDWTRQYLGDNPDRRHLPLWGLGSSATGAQAPMVHEAALVRTDAPTLEVVTDSISEAGRHLRLHIERPAGTYRTEVYLFEAMALHDLAINNRSIASSANADDAFEGVQSGRLFDHFGPAEEVLELSFVMPADRLLRLRLRAAIPGLPPLAEDEMSPRPDDMMIGLFERDMTMLQRTVELGE